MESNPTAAEFSQAGADLPDAALESSLAQAIRGFELLDQALELGGGQHVHLLGADGEGRMVLVLLVAGDPDTAPLRALDALRFGSRHGAALVRHLGHERLNAGARPRVVLVAEEFPVRTLERLAPLEDQGVEAYELRTLKSRGRESSYLEPVLGGVPQRGPAAPAGGAPDELLRSLTPGQREVALEVRARLERLDERLTIDTEGRSLIWRLEGEELAALAFEGELPARGSAPGSAARSLASERELELFVDDVVAEYLRRADPGWSTGGGFGRGQ